MKKIQDTPTHEVFLDYYKGQQVRIFRNKATGEIGFNTDDVSKILGYKDHADMMKDPKANEALKQSYSETRKMPITTIENTILN